MVVVQVKRSDTDVFLVESTITESNDALVRRLVSAGTNRNRHRLLVLPSLLSSFLLFGVYPRRLPYVHVIGIESKYKASSLTLIWATETERECHV